MSVRKSACNFFLAAAACLVGYSLEDQMPNDVLLPVQIMDGVAAYVWFEKICARSMHRPSLLDRINGDHNKLNLY